MDSSAFLPQMQHVLHLFFHSSHSDFQPKARLFPQSDHVFGSLSKQPPIIFWFGLVAHGTSPALGKKQHPPASASSLACIPMFRTLVEGARGTWRIEVVAYLHLRSRDLKLQRNFARNPSTESHLGPIRKKPRLKITFSLSWIILDLYKQFRAKKGCLSKKNEGLHQSGGLCQSSGYPLNLTMDIHEIPKFGANPFGPILWAQRPSTLSKFHPVFFGDLGLHANFLDQTARLEMVGCWFLYSTLIYLGICASGRKTNPPLIAHSPGTSASCAPDRGQSFPTQSKATAAERISPETRPEQVSFGRLGVIYQQQDLAWFESHTLKGVTEAKARWISVRSTKTVMNQNTPLQHTTLLLHRVIVRFTFQPQWIVIVPLSRG